MVAITELIRLIFVGKCVKKFVHLMEHCCGGSSLLLLQSLWRAEEFQ